MLPYAFGAGKTPKIHSLYLFKKNKLILTSIVHELLRTSGMQRIIGRYTGEERGPLLIIIAGLHGNETAGIRALEYLFDVLEVEPESNPEFTFRGRVVGLYGNMQAIQQGERYIHYDLNRYFTAENIRRVRRTPTEQLEYEDRELRQLMDAVNDEVADYQPDQLFILDIHTTTADGGIFSVTTDDAESIRIGVELHAPVITGMLHRVKGTALHYFTTANLGIPTVAVTFEAGQHDDPLSINRSIAAIVNCMRSIGCVRAEHVENRHDQLLQEYSRHLPKVAHLVAIHQIKEGDDFRMRPGYLNFQPVSKGEILAYDRHGPIRAPQDGHILMPHYQHLGNDGFFLVEAREQPEARSQ